jgi:prepilin-type N-terminal cleavage/methylation domain-containing protein/prepilin-type processing-associated H-X9-DG protein
MDATQFSSGRIARSWQDRCPNSMRPRTAFSLVELLVAISIIGILASMLLPAVATVRERATRLGCAGNLQQIGLAAVAYAGDNRGLFPPSYSNPNAWLTVRLYQPAYAPHGLGFLPAGGYLDSTAAVVCPGFPLRSAWGTFASRTACGAVIAGYRYNGNPKDLPLVNPSNWWAQQNPDYSRPGVSYSILNGWPSGPRRVSHSISLDRVILAYDVMTDAPSDAGRVVHTHPANTMKRSVVPVSLEPGGNAVFTDGHVAWLAGSKWGRQSGSMGTFGDYYCPQSGY